MDDAKRESLLAGAIENLEETAGVPGGDSRCAGGFDVAEFACEEVASHFGLDQIVNAGATAAPGALGKFDQFEIGN